MISLQLRGCRQIAEPRKYCFVRVIVFLWRAFSLFLFLMGWEFGLIPYIEDVFAEGEFGIELIRALWDHAKHVQVLFSNVKVKSE